MKMRIFEKHFEKSRNGHFKNVQNGNIGIFFFQKFSKHK